MPDVFKIFKDLELRAVGLDEKTNKMQEGYFCAFRSIGLPIHKDDYKNPYSPLGVNLSKSIPIPDATDPKDAPKTGSGAIDINQKFAANVAADQESYLSGFVLVDNKLQMNNSYAVMPSASKLSDTYYAIITGANGIPPASEINDEMKAAYERAQAVLQDKDENVTPKYEKYMQYQDEYRSKLKARNKAYASAFGDPIKKQQWPQDGVVYQDELEEAWNRWIGLGHKEEIEKAISILAAQGTDPAIALIARAKQRYENSLLEFPSYGKIPYTLFSPRTWYDKDNDDGWNEYSFGQFNDSSSFEASSTSFGGSARVNAGLWSASASFQHEESQANGSSKMSNTQIQFSYSVVDISRPGIDMSLLNLSNWFLVGDYKKGCISTGKMNQEKPNDGTEPSFLPSVVTSLIFVKDVLIRWDNWQSEWAQHQESTKGSASVGVCCFSAQANYSHAGVQRSFECEETKEGLRIPGIQLVGYVSQITPLCPQKDSKDYMKKIEIPKPAANK